MYTLRSAWRGKRETGFPRPACAGWEGASAITCELRSTVPDNGEEADLRTRLSAPARNLTQALYVSEDLPQTSRVMVKDEDLCVHCGLCAERCPTAAWDMQKSTLQIPYAIDEDLCTSRRKAG